ncbi:hypothetical protein [Aneurinibacillus migulanus]|uniref:hypothetical protein n=1 Tax=Aneurinibacillus migulanus TaxID=47500 RepID=UPI001F20DBBA|nr:hypothetical protein [Aneurinibacillus migulanus]
MINRQMFMVGGKKRRKDGGRERSDKDCLSSAGAQGASNLFFFPNLLFPTTLHCQNIKCNLYRF